MLQDGGAKGLQDGGAVCEADVDVVGGCGALLVDAEY